MDLAGQGARRCPDRGTPYPDLPPWDDDREWISRWQKAGPTLVEREPVLRAWLAAAPTRPLPRGLPAVELARVARGHGVRVEVDPGRHAARLPATGERVADNPAGLAGSAEAARGGDPA